MKKFAIILLMGGVLLSGCNYLDIVPDERNTPENTYQNPQAAKNGLLFRVVIIHRVRHS